MTKGYDKDKIGLEVARMLLDIDAVLLNPASPFTFTSGKVSPVYVDCRKIISFVNERSKIMDYSVQVLQNEISDDIDLIAGGETAGIPYAAYISDKLQKPMLYVRKKPKGFGRMAQIEGYISDKDKSAILIEDLTTDGGSKVLFCDVMRDAGLEVKHVFSLFYYDIFAEAEGILDKAGVQLHYLTTWWDILKVAKDDKLLDEQSLNEIENFLHKPDNWQARDLQSS